MYNTGIAECINLENSKYDKEYDQQDNICMHATNITTSTTTTTTILLYL